MKSRHSGGKTSWIALAVVLVLVIGACGSRRNQADLLAAAGGGRARASSGVSAGDVGGAGTGDLSDTGTGGAANSAGGAGPAAATGGGGAGPVASSGVQAGEAGQGLVAGASKSPISIGTVGAWSGVVGQSQGPYLTGLRAWIRYIDDRGGLNGHPINQLIVADDGGDSARNRQLAQQLIERNHVVALVFDGALDGSGTEPYVTQQGVPFVGGIGTGHYFYQSPVYFPQMPQSGALAETGIGEIQQAASEGKTKLGVIVCVESPKVCNSGITVSKRAAPRYGAQVVYSTTASITAPDYSAECLNARGAGAQVLLLAMDAASIRRIDQSCSRQGYHPLYATSSAVVSPDLAKVDDLQGMIVSAATAPVAVGQGPVQDFLAAMAKYAPTETLVDGQVEAWAAGKVLELGGRSLPEGDVPTLRKALLQGLWSIPRDTDIGIVAPLEYNPNRPASPTVCWFTETVQGHRFVSDGKRTCIPFDPSLVS